uniref:Keratin n=2 Tax=Anser TaxID=8842 RepID=A0A8B9BV06_9AVES
MSTYGQMLSSRCASPCEVTCPQPYADAYSQPCITSCGDSRAVVYPPPVVIHFPGPILSSCPQESIVGTSFPIPIGRGYSGGSLLFGSAYGSGSACNYSRSYSSAFPPQGRGYCSPYSYRRYSTYSRGSSGPC